MLTCESCTDGPSLNLLENCSYNHYVKYLLFKPPPPFFFLSLFFFPLLTTFLLFTFVFLVFPTPSILGYCLDNALGRKILSWKLFLFITYNGVFFMFSIVILDLRLHRRYLLSRSNLQHCTCLANCMWYGKPVSVCFAIICAISIKILLNKKKKVWFGIKVHTTLPQLCPDTGFLASCGKRDEPPTKTYVKTVFHIRNTDMVYYLCGPSHGRPDPIY